MKQICVKCGMEAKIVNLCNDCFLSSRQLFSIENFEINVCRDCGFCKDGCIEKGKEEEGLKKIIRERIKTSNSIQKTKIILKHFGNKCSAVITCYGYINPCKQIKKETREATIKITARKCDTCSKLSGGYYEAVVQVRGDDKEEILKKIKTFVSKDKPVITSIEKTKYGYDLKFIRKSAAARVAKQFGVAKKSYKFVATKKGKKIYRNYYLVG